MNALGHIMLSQPSDPKSASDYRQVDELDRAMRSVFIGSDIGFLIGTRVVVHVIRHTCVHALVDSLANVLINVAAIHWPV
jgi:hypothetical protein